MKFPTILEGESLAKSRLPKILRAITNEGVQGGSSRGMAMTCRRAPNRYTEGGPPPPQGIPNPPAYGPSMPPGEAHLEFVTKTSPLRVEEAYVGRHAAFFSPVVVVVGKASNLRGPLPLDPPSIGRRNISWHVRRGGGGGAAQTMRSKRGSRWPNNRPPMHGPRLLSWPTSPHLFRGTDESPDAAIEWAGRGTIAIAPPADVESHLILRHLRREHTLPLETSGSTCLSTTY
jgi:hypothetical protein